METNTINHETTPKRDANLSLIGEKNLIPIFLEDMVKAGLVGEQENAATVLFSAASAALDSPINVSIHGTSSAGKKLLAR